MPEQHKSLRRSSRRRRHAQINRHRRRLEHEAVYKAPDQNIVKNEGFTGANVGQVWPTTLMEVSAKLVAHRLNSDIASVAERSVSGSRVGESPSLGFGLMRSPCALT